MIYIASAMGAEAAPILKAFGLKQAGEIAKVPIYTNDEIGVGLFLTGVGELSAAISTAAVIAKRDDCSFLFNVGIAGLERKPVASEKSSRENAVSDEEGLFVINKIHSESLGRDYYPDMMLRTGLPEASLVTSVSVWKETEQTQESDQNDEVNEAQTQVPAHGQVLHDMEGAGVFAAASRYLTADRIMLLKVVSDFGKDSEQIDKNSVKRLMESVLPKLKELIELAKVYDEEDEKKKEAEVLAKEVAQIASERLHLSITMQYELRQLLLYKICRDGKCPSFLQGVLEKQAASKVEGKKELEAIRRSIMG